MQRIGEEAARLFKAAAGIKQDEPISSFVFALYGFLFLVAMTLFFVWITGAPIECAVQATC